MTEIHHILIEGVDRLGKSTLIRGLLDKRGYHQVIHLEKPKKLDYYVDPKNPLNDPLQDYQRQTYVTMFNMLQHDFPLIFDRAHLGEVVYSPMYRGYSGDYVYDLERILKPQHALLVLLYTDDFSFVEDDGESHDFSKKEDEQDKFRAAFDRSNMQYKLAIDVSNGRGGYRKPEEILQTVLKALQDYES